MPRPKNREARVRLIEKGGELFRRMGFNACGIQEITAAAGIPKGSFYHYFVSKDVFAAAILDEYWNGIDANYGGILKNESVDPAKRIEMHFAQLIAYHRGQNFRFGCLIGNFAVELAAQSTTARSKLRSILRVWTAALANCLAAAKKNEAKASLGDLRELAAALIEAFEGSVMLAKVERNGKVLHRFQALILPALIA